MNPPKIFEHAQEDVERFVQGCPGGVRCATLDELDMLNSATLSLGLQHEMMTCQVRARDERALSSSINWLGKPSYYCKASHGLIRAFRAMRTR
jgi:hypothetical protein